MSENSTGPRNGPSSVALHVVTGGRVRAVISSCQPSPAKTSLRRPWAPQMPPTTPSKQQRERRGGGAMVSTQHRWYPRAKPASARRRYGRACDVLCHPDRGLRRQHDAELAYPDAVRLHGDEQVQQHRIVRQLGALHVEVVLGEADRMEPELV